MWKMVGAFAIAFVWDWVGVWGTRSYAAQSWAALPLSALLMAFWIAGVQVARSRRYWGALVAGAVLGTWVGISWPN